MGAFGNRSHEDGTSMLATLGQFWVRAFDRPDVLAGLFTGVGTAFNRGVADLLITTDAASKYNVPLRTCAPLVRLFASAEERAAYPAFRYGDGLQFGRLALYGQSGDPRALRLPDGILDVGYITDDPAAPTVTYINGLHFTVDARMVRFFDQLIPASGDVELWLCEATIDDNPVYEFYGRAFGLEYAPTEHYRALVSALFDLTHNGPTDFFVRQAIGSALGVPCSAANGPVYGVEVYGTDLVITVGARVYRYPATSIPAVSVGDDVQSGDPLVKTVWFSDATLIDATVKRLVFGRNIVRTVSGALGFDNKFVPVKRVGSGFQFEISGTADDVQSFWDGLDYSAIPDPGYVVNPAQYAYDLVRHNATVVSIDYNRLPAGIPGLGALSALTEYLPPHIVYCVQSEIEETDDFAPFEDEITWGGMGPSVVSESPAATTAYVNFKTKVNACL